MLLGYLGPRTNSEIAAKKYAESIVGLRLKDYPTIDEVFDSLNSQDSDRIIVPVYNTLTGRINGHEERILNGSFNKIFEISIKINHCLASKSLNFRGIASHPEALKQCKTYLEKYFRDFEMISTLSTNEAAKLADSNPKIAAIANLETCLHYGLEIVDRDLVKNNFSQFFVLEMFK